MPRFPEPHATPRGRRQTLRRLLHPLAFTLALVGLIAVGISAQWQFTLEALCVSALGFGFFFLAIPGGTHFGITFANFLAVYACAFVFFRDVNFRGAAYPVSILSLALPVLTFLAACLLQRRRIAVAIRIREMHQPEHLAHVASWVPYVFLVGAASFAWPELGLGPAGQGAALFGSMAVIALVVAFAVRDVVLLLVDVAQLFQSVLARLDRLVMPVLAFVTFYALLVVVFACLYRVAQLTGGAPQFTLHGEPVALNFPEAVYFSVVTIATVGYGDYAPATGLVRTISAIEFVCGLLLLLFGFSEIMRAADGEREARRPRQEPRQARPHEDVADSGHAGERE